MTNKSRISILAQLSLVLVVFIGVFAALPAFASPFIIYVDQNAGGLDNGSSWANAFTDLQSALGAATPGYEIWVAAGTYKPTTGTDRSASFSLKKEVEILGGFSGKEALQSERNPQLNVTILSGDIGLPGDPSDNSAHVVQAQSVDGTAVLDGFTIQGGNANGPMTDNAGGGISIFYSNPTLSNLTLENNSAGTGSAIYNYNSSPALMNVTVQNNTGLEGSRGGAITNDTNSSPSLTNVTFHNNTAAFIGGAMLNFTSNPTLVNVTFVGNAVSSIPSRGGAIYNWQSNPILKNVTFTGNSATDGAGIYNDENSNPVIVNSILYDDSNSEIFNNSGAATVSFSIVQGGYSGAGNLDVDPLLGPLQINGGYTMTMALRANSPAIDAGDNASCPSTDQREVTRPSGLGCDIGAYEYLRLLLLK